MKSLMKYFLGILILISGSVKKNLDEMTILDEFILDFNMQNMYIEEGVKDVLVSRIAKILKPLDKILSQNVKAIFPLV